MLINENNVNRFTWRWCLLEWFSKSKKIPNSFVNFVEMYRSFKEIGFLIIYFIMLDFLEMISGVRRC
jgi:hypothetical protein